MKNIKLIVISSFIVTCAAGLCFAGFSEELNSAARGSGQEAAVQTEQASEPVQQEAASGEEASEPAQQAAETPSEPVSEDTPERSVQAAGESSGGGYDGSSVVNLSSSFQTDMFTGRATFNIPIEVPAGRRGIQPNLNLVYQSQGPDTWCGTGWTLDMGSIERSTKKGVPSYDDAKDTFVLNFNGSSSELVKIAANEYRMENEPHAMKVEFISGYWVCTDASGAKYYFGQSQDAQVKYTGVGIYSWLLEKVQDIHGNYMLITYTRDQNELYINRISYAGNSQLGDQPTYIVDFELEERDDDITNYRPKFKITTAKRLKSIVVKYADPLSNYSETPLTCYGISYTYSNKTKKSLVTSIKRYNADRSDSLPEVKFTYNENNQRFGQASAWKTLGSSLRYMAADFNGDGLTDLGYYWDPLKGSVPATTVSFFFAFSNGNGFNAATSSTLYSRKYPFFYNTYFIYKLEPGDFNGDGKTDIITKEVLTNCIIGAVPFNGVSFDNTKRANLDLSTLPTSYDLGDFNGDGLNDIALTPFTSTNTVSIHLSNGSGFNAASSTHPIENNHVLYYADCNGDGLTDAVDYYNGTWQVALCNGNGFEPAQTWLTNFGTGYSTYCMDVNDDGMADAVVNENATGKWYFAPSTGSAFGALQDLVTGFGPGAPPMSGDFNGDSMLDMGYCDSTGTLYIAKSQGMPNDILIGIDNSVGGKIDISYKSYNGASNTDTALKDDLPFATWVVDKVTSTDLVTGDSFDTAYSYDAGVYNFTDREFRGFGYVKVTDHEGNYSETYFCQDDIFKGREYKEKAFDAAGTCLAETVTTWQSQKLYSDKINFPYQPQADSYTYDVGVTKHTRAKTSYSFSGDFISSTEGLDEGDVDDASDDKTAITKYCHNTAAWILNLPYETELRDSTGASIKKGRVYYDGSTTLGATPVKGLPTKQEAWLDKPSEKWLSTTVEYDDYGHAKKSFDPKGNSIETTYESVLHQYPLTVKNALNQTQQFEYEYKTGQIKTSTDPNNQKTENKYDSLYRLLKIVGPKDTENNPSVFYEYDLSMVPNRVTKKVKTDYNSSNYLTTYSFSDGFGRPIQVRSPAEPVNGAQKQVVSGDVVYDYRGKVKEEYRSYFDDYSTSYSTKTRSLAKTVYDYDALGRIVKITTQKEDGSDIFAQNSYSGWKITSTDFNGNLKDSYYDASGRLVRVTEHNGVQEYNTAYEYDDAGNLKKVTDNQGNVTTINYDSLGRKLSMTDPDMGTWNYTYDDNGNLITQTDAKGQKITFVYDALNRLTGKSGLSPQGTVPDFSVSYTYDTGVNGLGRLNRVDYSNGYTTFTYDELGRETKSIKSIDGTAYTVERTYDALDRLKTLKYPDSEVLTYTYYTSGALKKIQGLTKTYVSDITYNEQGQMKKLTYGNGVTTDYTYNQYTQRLEHLLSLRGGAEAIQDLEYKFDNVGNIETITDRKNTATQSFQYDGLNRLKYARNDAGYGILNFAYDSIGNMTQKGNAVLRYPISGPGAVRPHAATSYTLGSTTYALAYDANGNMLSKGDITYEYDTENRLKKVAKPNSSISGTFNIELKAGWNFFSLPCVPTGLSPQGTVPIADALKSIAGKYSQVTRYDTQAGKYESYVGNSAYDQFNAMEYLKGYQIYCDAACTLTITGSSPSAAYGLPLAKGNNLVGVDITNNGKFVSAAFSGIAYSSIKWYNPNTKTLETLDSDDEVFMGRSYWLNVTSASIYSISTLTYSTSFTYDGDGGRVKKTVNNVSTIYVGSLFEKTSGVNTRHIYLGDNRICSVTSTGSTSFYHGDHLGSTSDVTDSSGNVIQHTEYQPYGEFSVTSATKGDGTDYLFTGQLFDKSTNLYYYGARYYDPELGRFTQADTIVPQPGDPQAFNRYSYCRNNPIIYTDPSGHSWLSKTWKKVKKAVKKAFRNIASKLKKCFIAQIAVFAVAFIFGGPEVAFSVQTLFAATAAAATTLALDTGEGRQLVNRVGHEFFDDILGMPPGMAHSFAYATLQIAGTIVINAGLNALAGQTSGSSGAAQQQQSASKSIATDKFKAGNFQGASDQLKSQYGAVEGSAISAEQTVDIILCGQKESTDAFFQGLKMLNTMKDWKVGLNYDLQKYALVSDLAKNAIPTGEIALIDIFANPISGDILFWNWSNSSQGIIFAYQPIYVERGVRVIGEAGGRELFWASGS